MIDDAGLQHILVDKCLTNAVRIFTLLFEVILGFSGVACKLGIDCLQYLYGAKNMNMISTGAFQTEMDASNKQPTLAEKFAAVWEKKNAKAARAGGVSLMALSLAACGSDDDDGGSSSSGDTSSTSGTTTVMTVSPESVSASADISAPRDYTPGGNDLVNTLQTDDTITGVAGTAQTLTVTFGNNNDAGAATIAPTVSNVETITFNNVSSNAAADTLDMSNISGATTINVSSLSDDTIIRGMDDTSIALTAKNVSDEAADVAFEFDTDATGMTGTATTVDLSIDNFNGAQISLGAGAAAATAGTGVEIVTLTSSGKASTVASLAATGVTDINATATADTTITTVSTTALDTVTMTSSAGVTTSIDVVDNVNANAAFHYTGGAGDDTLRINDGFQGGAVEAADDLRGGEGTDALRVDVDTAGTTVGALDENSAAVVTGFESVMLSQEANAGTTTTDMDFFSGATSLDLRTVVGANTFTINDISDAQAGDIDLTVTAAAGAAATTVNLDLKDGWGNHLRLDLRKTKIKSIIDKNNLVVPNEIIRNEHYFYKAGQIIWIIFSEDKDIALIKYDKEKLSEYISDVKKIHQNFENKFRFKNYDKIKF